MEAIRPDSAPELSQGAVDENDGVLPSLNVPQVLLAGLAKPLPVLWGLTLPFGLALAMLGHPWVGLFSCLANMTADAVAQGFYKRWLVTAETDDHGANTRRIGWAVGCRAAVATISPVVAVLMGGSPADLAFLGLMACLLLCVAVAQGSLSPWLFWMSGIPVLIGLTIVATVQFPPLSAAALLLAVGMLILILLTLSGGIGAILGEWDGMRDRNNRLIERLRAERTEAEKAREAARRAGQAKANFLATMSHEIRTPMNGVLGMAQLLRRSNMDGEQRAQVETLIHSGEFLMSILNDILDISKIDAGKMEVEALPQNLAAFAGELDDLWRPTAEQKGLSFKLDLADGLPSCVLMDSRRVRQVLFNLIGNAVKFTPSGAVTLAVIAENAGQTLRFTVADTGIGIDPNLLPSLFERFSQADDSISRQFGGAGLGLAISRQLTEAMGGKLWAESTPGRGSAFHVMLPLHTSELEVVEASDPVEAEPTCSLSVLAVDDNSVNLMVLEQILGALGHQVARASSGAEALEQLAAQPFDLVLMDIQMPGMSGIEAVTALRGRPGPNRATPAVAVSADVLSRDRAGYLALGFSGQVSKPIQVPALMAEIAAVVAPQGAETGLAVNA